MVLEDSWGRCAAISGYILVAWNSGYGKVEQTAIHRVLRGVLVTGTTKRRQGDCRPGGEYRKISPEILTIEVADQFVSLGRQHEASRYARMAEYPRGSYLRHVIE